MADPEAAAETAAQAETASRSARALRYLCLFRTGFSAFWVALVFALASARPADRTVGWLAASLLVIYPVSDAVATVFDARSSRVSAGRAQRLNLTVDVAAAICVLGRHPVHPDRGDHRIRRVDHPQRHRHDLRGPPASGRWAASGR